MQRTTVHVCGCTSVTQRHWHDRTHHIAHYTPTHALTIVHSSCRYAAKILPSEAVLVPLCGKTVDMAWLAQRPGVSVVIGTEAVEQAMLDLELRPGDILGFQKIPEGQHSNHTHHHHHAPPRSPPRTTMHAPPRSPARSPPYTTTPHHYASPL
jgi:hypothetical protein